MAEYSEQEVLSKLSSTVEEVGEGSLNQLGSMINLLDAAQSAGETTNFEDLRGLMSNLMVLSGEAFEFGRNELREAIHSRLETGEGSSMDTSNVTTEDTAQSLYDKLGQEASVKALVEDFYQRVMGDPALASIFEGIDMGKLKRHQALFISQALGGPKQYDGRSMKEAHQGLNISEDHFSRVGEHLANAMSGLGVSGPDVDHVMAIVVSLKDQIVSEGTPQAAHPVPPPLEDMEEEIPDIDEEFFQEFVAEALSHLRTIELEILSLETDPGNKVIVNNIFRPFHTIKGAAGFMGLTEIASICHDIENILDDARKGVIEVKGAVSDLVLESVDLLISMLQTCRDAESPIRALRQFSNQTKTFLEHAAEIQANPDQQATPTLIGEKLRLGDILVENHSVSQENLEDALRIQGETGKNLGEILIQQKDVKPIEVAQALRMQHGAETAAQAAPAAVEEVAVSSSDSSGDSIRVRTSLLDQLMNLAGELVLGRNQLTQKLDLYSDNIQGLNSILHSVDRVTSEIQEAVMQTRMQPLKALFSRFRRVVRDLSREMGKKINLSISGETVEMDKTLIEALGDPLTHMIRNAIDHGIEMPDKRQEAGKPETGLITLSAYHEGGKVHVKLTDDGAGVDIEKVKAKAVDNGLLNWERAHQLSDRDALRLLFAPGFSTAEKITGVSGRGVGMDVVLSNIEKIGGTVEITSVIGKGSTILLNLPLTLAIVPALIVSAQEQRFAIPQTNLLELVHLEDSEAQSSILQVRGSEVYSLRGKLLPLIRLGQVLRLEPNAEEETESLTTQADPTTPGGGPPISIVVMSTGQNDFGLIVDRVFDTEEIVVKPLSSLLKDVGVFSGATLMGDGRPALILDITGLSKAAEITVVEEGDVASIESNSIQELAREENQTILLFNINHEEQMAVPLTLISRLETVRMSDVRTSINGKVIPYRGKLLPLIFMEDHLPVTKPPETRETVKVLVFEIEHTVGLVVSEIIDSVEIPVELDNSSITKKGFSGMAIVDKNPTAFVDIYQVIEMAYPEWFQHDKESRRQELNRSETTILLAEDSSFYRNVERNYLIQEGFKVLEAENGAEALELLKKHSVDLVVTDIEMPHMDGFDLTRNIRGHTELKHLPIIAVTSLSQDEERNRGMSLGMDAYLVKLQREQLLTEIYTQLSARKKMS